jgi:hypothetical protein
MWTVRAWLGSTAMWWALIPSLVLAGIVACRLEERYNKRRLVAGDNDAYGNRRHVAGLLGHYLLASTLKLQSDGAAGENRVESA